MLRYVGLEPGTEQEYQVRPGRHRAPAGRHRALAGAGSGVPAKRAPDAGMARPLRLSFGSCRIAELPVVRRRRATYVSGDTREYPGLIQR